MLAERAPLVRGRVAGAHADADVACVGAPGRAAASAMPAIGERRLRSTSWTSALSGETYSTRSRSSGSAGAGSPISRSRHHRNAARVLPLPVGRTDEGVLAGRDGRPAQGLGGRRRLERRPRTSRAWRVGTTASGSGVAGGGGGAAVVGALDGPVYRRGRAFERPFVSWARPSATPSYRTVTLLVADQAPTFPAASRARTRNWYRAPFVAGIVSDVPVVARPDDRPRTTRLVGAPRHRSEPGRERHQQRVGARPGEVDGPAAYRARCLAERGVGGRPVRVPG